MSSKTRERRSRLPCHRPSCPVLFLLLVLHNIHYSRGCFYKPNPGSLLSRHGDYCIWLYSLWASTRCRESTGSRTTDPGKPSLLSVWLQDYCIRVVRRMSFMLTRRHGRQVVHECKGFSRDTMYSGLRGYISACFNIFWWLSITSGVVIQPGQFI